MIKFDFPEVPRKSPSSRRKSLSPKNSNEQDDILLQQLMNLKTPITPLSKNASKDEKLLYQLQVMTQGIDSDAIEKLFSIRTVIYVDKNKYYTIVKTLGKGNFGITFLVTDKTNKFYALKFLNNKSDSEREIKCLKRVQTVCGNLVLCFHENFEYNTPSSSGIGKLYGIVTEYKEELISLQEYLGTKDNMKHRLTKEEYNHIIKKLKKGLQKLEDVGVTHGDFYIRNILYNPNNKKDVKIIDFGSCAMTPDLDLDFIEENKIQDIEYLSKELKKYVI
jgi:serine/threonine protein kinase